jgi:hypothetical protein
MDGLEYVVRPFTTPGPHGTVIIPSTPSGSRGRATLKWQATGEDTTRTEVSDGVDFEVVCCKENLTEKSRESDQKRIYQNGNTSSPNWVDVQRPRHFKLKKKNQNKCGDDWDTFSGVGQEIADVLGGFEEDLHSGTVKSKDETCSVTWTFENK